MITCNSLQWFDGFLKISDFSKKFGLVDSSFVRSIIKLSLDTCLTMFGFWKVREHVIQVDWNVQQFIQFWNIGTIRINSFNIHSFITL